LLQALIFRISFAIAASHASARASTLLTPAILLNLGEHYLNLALWILVLVFFAQARHATRTRRAAAVLAGVSLVLAVWSIYSMATRLPESWHLGSLPGGPIEIAYYLFLVPALSVYHWVCRVLFPYALWRDPAPPNALPTGLEPAGWSRSNAPEDVR
jgi:hypothetical protein